MKLKLGNSGPIKAVIKYLGVYFVSLKETFYYPQKLRATAIIVPFRIFVMLLIYRYAFNYLGRSINGINVNMAIWSIAIYHVLLYTQFRGIFSTINNEIRMGVLETQINKPYDYLIYKFWEHLGKGLPNLIISLITVFPLLYFMTGGIPTSLSLLTVFGAFCITVAGILVSAMVYIFVALPALWIDDAQPFFWLVDKAIMVLGGAYIPLALLPNSFQTFANLTPFGAPMFTTQMFNPNFSNIWPSLLGVQIIWVILLSISISVLFSRAQLRLSINGG